MRQPLMCLQNLNKAPVMSEHTNNNFNYPPYGENIYPSNINAKTKTNDENLNNLTQMIHEREVGLGDVLPEEESKPAPRVEIYQNGVKVPQNNNMFPFM